MNYYVSFHLTNTDGHFLYLLKRSYTYIYICGSSSKSRLYVRVCVRMRSYFVCAFLFNCQKQFTNFIKKLCASRINLSIRHHSTRPPEKLLKVQHCFFVYICACSLPREDSTAYPPALFGRF